MSKTRCLVWLVSVGTTLLSLAFPCYGQSEFSEFKTKIQKSNSELLAIHRLGEHAATLLRNPAFQTTFREVVDLEPKVALDWLDANGQFVPETMVIAADQQVYDFVGNLILAALLRRVIIDGALAEGEMVEAERRHLHNQFVEVVSRMKIPQATLYLKWPNPFVPKLIFPIISTEFSKFRRTTFLDFKKTELSFRLEGSVSDVLNREAVRYWLAEDLVGLDELDEQLVNRIFDTPILLVGEQLEHGIRLSFGANPPFQETTELTDLVGFEDGPRQIAYAKWNASRIKAARSDLYHSSKFWSSTRIGENLSTVDLFDQSNILGWMANRADRMADQGFMRVWYDANGVKCHLKQIGVGPSSGLKNQQILNYIPENIESYVLTSTSSMGDCFSQWLYGFERRLNVHPSDSQIVGNEMIMFLKMVSRRYDQHFSNWRRVVLEDLSPSSQPPFAVVIDTAEKLDTPDQAGENQEVDSSNRQLNDFPRVAFVGASDNPQQTRTTLLQAYKEFVTGVLSAHEVDYSEKDLDVIKKLELSPGLNAQAMTLDWMENFEITEAEFETDFQPHLLIQDGLVIFSTSPAFSRKLLSTESPIKLATQDNDIVVRQAVIQGKTAGSCCRALCLMLIEAVPLPDENAQNAFRGLAEGTARFASLLKHLEWKSTQNQNVRTTVYRLDFHTEQ